MAESNGNGKGCPPYLKDPKFWVWCLVIITGVSFAWANLKNDVSATRSIVDVNSGRISTIERTMPEINEKLATIQTDISWMKRNLK